VIFFKARTTSKLNELSLEHDGLTRWFLEYQPDSFTKRSKDDIARLVIVLHGGTESMRNIFQRSRRGTTGRWLTLSNEQGFLVLAPNGVSANGNNDTKGDNQNWNDQREDGSIIDDVGFITRLVNWAITERGISLNHIYVTGASNGGMMTYRMLIEQPNLFASGAAFIANLPDKEIMLPVNSTPIMLVLGTSDPLTKWEGGEIANGRGTVRSALATRDFWIQANHLNATPFVSQQLDNYNRFDNCVIESQLYDKTNTTSSSNASEPLLFYTMKGGGHVYPEKSRRIFSSWILRRILGPPCRDASGIDLAWTFMVQFSR
jgi:polyhydroxybutyrate depolymerase